MSRENINKYKNNRIKYSYISANKPIKKIYIVGTGAFAAELTEYIYQNNIHGNEKIKILGYFDIDCVNYSKYKYSAKFLGSERCYNFLKEDSVLIAIGDQKSRTKVLSYFIENGIKIDSFVHYTAIVSKISTIGIGNIICPFVTLGPNSIIGNYNLINYYSSIAHDCEIGNNNVISPNVHITGFCSIKDNNFFGTASGVKPNLKIGTNNKIQAGLIVDRNLENDSILFNIEKIKTIKNLNK